MKRMQCTNVMETLFLSEDLNHIFLSKPYKNTYKVLVHLNHLQYSSKTVEDNHTHSQHLSLKLVLNHVVVKMEFHFKAKFLKLITRWKELKSKMIKIVGFAIIILKLRKNWSYQLKKIRVSFTLQCQKDL